MEFAYEFNPMTKHTYGGGGFTIPVISELWAPEWNQHGKKLIYLRAHAVSRPLARIRLHRKESNEKEVSNIP